VIKAIRGMHDILPEHNYLWHFFEQTARSILDEYGYQQIRTPVVEATELFLRSIGDVTDIVEKEMYSFSDRSGESITLRPEGTASCARASSEHGLIHNAKVQKLWYLGPMFRYERPQKGRLRQFHQLGVEVFNAKSAHMEVELMLLTARLWHKLGISHVANLQINSLGTLDDRKRYKTDLSNFLHNKQHLLDEDSKRRLITNPLRILDSKDKETQELLSSAPKLIDYLSVDSKLKFNLLTEYLDELGVAYEINPKLVRGLDYYNDTVFEWVTDKLGAQGTICAGGRYDDLVRFIGGKPAEGVGFAMGIERLILLISEHSTVKIPSNNADIYFCVLDDCELHSFKLIEQLHNDVPNLKIMRNVNGGNLSNQLKKAANSEAKCAFILGERECSKQTVTVKTLFTQDEQQEISWVNLTNFIVNQVLGDKE